MPRFSHHREPVLNHTDPINPQHKLRCTADALPFAIMAGWEPLCCDILNLAYSQVYASTNLDCSCLGGTVRRHREEASDWSSVRDPIPVSRSGASVFCSCPQTTPWCPHSVQGSACTQGGQSPLHQSICLPRMVYGMNIDQSLV